MLPSGLFWTFALQPSQVHFSRDDRRATMKVRGLPIIDTFFFFGPDDTPATVDFDVEWRSDGSGDVAGRRRR